MSVMTLNGREFRMERDMIDVTMLHRPDTAWLHLDAHGHEHRWFTYVADQWRPAIQYDPSAAYDVPTLRYVVDERWVDDEGGERERGHNECLECGEHIAPGYKSDDHRQVIPGLAHYYIDGEPVSEEVFKREAGI